MCRIRFTKNHSASLGDLWNLMCQNAQPGWSKGTAFEVMDDLIHRFGRDATVRIEIMPVALGREFDKGDLKRISELEDCDIKGVN